MKIIQFDKETGRVVHILNGRDDVTIENLMITSEIPAFEDREGYNAELYYSQEEEKLYWEYIEIPEEELVEPEASPMMAMRMSMMGIQPEETTTTEEEVVE